MDYWHAQDRSHPTALVKQMDLPAAAEGARAAAACLRDGGGSAALRAARRLAHHAWGEGEGEFVEERLLDLLAKRVWGGCSVRRSSSQLHHGPHLPSAGWRLRVRRGVRVRVLGGGGAPGGLPREGAPRRPHRGAVGVPRRGPPRGGLRRHQQHAHLPPRHAGRAAHPLRRGARPPRLGERDGLRHSRPSAATRWRATSTRRRPPTSGRVVSCWCSKPTGAHRRRACGRSTSLRPRGAAAGGGAGTASGAFRRGLRRSCRGGCRRPPRPAATRRSAAGRRGAGGSCSTAERSRSRAMRSPRCTAS